MDLNDDLDVFAKEVGDTGPVVPVGGRTQWSVGGPPAPGAREVRAPAGIVEYEPAEMVVRVRAGTTVAEVDAAVAAHGQMVALDPADPARATVGGVLAVGHSGLRRLRYGPIRDTVLEVRFVTAEGRVAKAGGPVVKNVTGYDLGRVLVGSLGTLGVLAEVVLRAQPRPPAAVWLRGDGADPFGARDRLFRPSSVLWDGTATWVLLEGHPTDVAEERSRLRSAGAFEEVGEGPEVPGGGQRSLRPHELRTWTAAGGRFVAEVGVGTIHTDGPVPVRAPDPSTLALQQRVKSAFDPTGRLNPGREVYAA